jgi:hypothetical protein
VTKKEVGLLGTALRALGASAGGAVGGYFGNPIAGGAAGSSLGAALSKWMGAGDYQVTSNSVVSSMKASNSIPSMHTNDQSVIVRHKEFVMTVTGSTSFQVRRSLIINPGRATTFPWLANIASNYQQYRIKGMVFHYVPTSGASVASSNTSLGSVMLQTSYRSTDTVPVDKIELLNEYWSSEAVPSEPFCHPIECNPKENPFNIQYVRTDGAVIPVSDSPLLYDLGVTHVAVQGQQVNGAELGDLWVTYEVELKKPIITSNATTSGYFTAGINTGGLSLANPLTGMAFSRGNIGIIASGNTVTFPANVFGTFFVFVAYTGSLTNFTQVAAPTVGNCSLVNLQPAQSFFSNTSTGAGTDTTIAYGFSISKRQRENAATAVLGTATASGTLDQVTLYIFGFPY